MKFLGIRNSNILMSSLDKFCSELVFEFLRSSIDLYIFKVLVELELIELFLLELFEGLLNGDFGCMVL